MRILILLLLLLMAPLAAPAEDMAAIMAAVEARDEGRSESAELRITLIDADGGEILRQALSLRLQDDGRKRQAIYFTSPRALRGSAFLSWDEKAADAADQRWLYLPALRRVRRIPSSDRGEYFLGTDLTYDDVRRRGKVDATDYHFLAASPADAAGRVTVSGEPVNDSVARELGYSRGEWQVDRSRDFIVTSRYWDLQGELLKSIHYRNLEQIEGVWVARRIEVRNHKTGHQTLLEFADVAINVPLDERQLEPRGLDQGAAR